MVKVDDPQFSGDVWAVVMDPTDFTDQQSYDRETPETEHKFYELLKRTAHEVLTENSVPVRRFGHDDWMKVADASRNDDGSLDFANAVGSLLRENDANLFITIGGYFDQEANLYQYDIGILNSEGVRFLSSHMEFEDEVVKLADREAVRKKFEIWFDENFERTQSGD